MEIPYFIGNEDGDESNPMEWLGIVKKYGINDVMEKKNCLVKLVNGG
jgi:hypothetical protein